MSDCCCICQHDHAIISRLKPLLQEFPEASRAAAVHAQIMHRSHQAAC